MLGGRTMVLFDHVYKFKLKDMDLHIPKGTVLGVIGASGAGKTTFLKLAAGLLRQEKGHIRICGKDPIVDRRKVSNRISALFIGAGEFVANSNILSNRDFCRIA